MPSSRRILELARLIVKGESALDDLRALLVRDESERVSAIDMESLLDDRPTAPPAAVASPAAPPAGPVLPYPELPDAPPTIERKRPVRPYIRDCVWQAILTCPDVFDVKDMVRCIPTLNISTGYKNLSIFCAGGWIKRVGPGQYSRTDRPGSPLVFS